jgi:large subunit ribosomal protein L11
MDKGSKSTKHEPPVQIGRDRLQAIAQEKMRDLNTDDLERAMRIVEGTARSMGIEVV